jgi:hypothetical protein
VRIRERGALVVAGGRAVMSTIELGDGDAGAGDEDEVKDVVVAGNRDRPLDVNEGWDTKLVSKSSLSNGHQSNVASEAPGVLD